MIYCQPENWTFYIFPVRVSWEIVAAAQPKKIDARILVNLVTGMIYTSRRLSTEWKPHAATHSLIDNLPYVDLSAAAATATYAAIVAAIFRFSLQPRVKNHVLIPSLGFKTTRRRFLFPSLPGEPQTAKLNDLGISVVSDKNTRKLVINYVIKPHSKFYKTFCAQSSTSLPHPQNAVNQK